MHSRGVIKALDLQLIGNKDKGRRAAWNCGGRKTFGCGVGKRGVAEKTRKRTEQKKILRAAMGGVALRDTAAYSLEK